MYMYTQGRQRSLATGLQVLFASHNVVSRYLHAISLRSRDTARSATKNISEIILTFLICIYFSVSLDFKSKV